MTDNEKNAHHSIEVQLQYDLWHKATEYCKETGVSMTGLVAMALRKFLNFW